VCGKGEQRTLRVVQRLRLASVGKPLGQRLVDPEPTPDAAVTDAAEIGACRQELQTVWCHRSLKEYCVRIVQRTRDNSDVALGASPRGSLGLLHASQARAAAKGREYVTPDDIKELAHRVLGHRIVLRANAELRGVTTVQVIDEVLASEVVPAERELMAGEGS